VGGEGRKVMESLPNEDRGLFLAFAWGRRRMPSQVRGGRGGELGVEECSEQIIFADYPAERP
jgi:hypothetical protein